MKLEENIDETLTRICDQFAVAIERYDAISGGELPPEQLISSQILLGLGDVLTMTAETNSTKLWEWQADIKRRANALPPSETLPPALTEYRQLTGARRVDLVVFTGDHTKKE